MNGQIVYVFTDTRSSGMFPRHGLLFLSRGVGKVYCDVIIEAVTAYQYFDQHLL